MANATLRYQGVFLIWKFCKH